MVNVAAVRTWIFGCTWEVSPSTKEAKVALDYRLQIISLDLGIRQLLYCFRG